MIISMTNNEIANSTAERRIGRHIRSLSLDTNDNKIVAIHSIPWLDKQVDNERKDIDYIHRHYGVKGLGINVYTLDSGVDSNHDAFSTSNLFTHSFLPNDARHDECGHGTWLAGIIVGKQIGLAPECSLHSLRVLDDSGSGRSDFTTKGLDFILKNKTTPHIVLLPMTSLPHNTSHEKLIWQLYSIGALILTCSQTKYLGVVSITSEKQKTLKSTYLDNKYRSLTGSTPVLATTAATLILALSYMHKKKDDTVSPCQIRDRLLKCAFECDFDIKQIFTII